MQCTVLSGYLEFSGYEHGTRNAVTACGFLDLPFGTKTGNFIVGFNQMELSYGNSSEDHHVREMGLKLSANLDAGNNKRILLTARAYMNDDADHHMPPKNQKLRYVVIAYPEHVTLPSVGLEIRALSSFDVKYRKKSHHVSSYGAFGDGEDSCICDDSGNIDHGKSTINMIKVPYEDYLELRALKIRLVYRFYIAMTGGDHHVSHTGFKVTDTGCTFDLSDKHGQHACDSICYIFYDV